MATVGRRTRRSGKSLVVSCRSKSNSAMAILGRSEHTSSDQDLMVPPKTLSHWISKLAASGTTESVSQVGAGESKKRTLPNRMGDKHHFSRLGGGTQPRRLFDAYRR